MMKKNLLKISVLAAACAFMLPLIWELGQQAFWLNYRLGLKVGTWLGAD